MRRFLITVVSLGLLLAACSSADPQTEEAFLAEHDLAGMTAVEIIDHLDRLGGSERPSDLMASVRPDELLLSDEASEVALTMPEDRFYVSVAPYVNDTHDCFYHSLTTCTGELSGESVQVTIVDRATGDVLVDEETTTFANGFVGFWLPRDIEGTIKVEYDGKTGEADLSTRDDGATCVTTLQLA